MFTWILNLFYPPTCLVCRSAQMFDGICGECWSKMTFLNEPACERCYRQFDYELPDSICSTCSSGKHNLDKVRSPLVYDEHSRGLIMSFKNHNNITAAKVIAKLIMTTIRDLKMDYVIPVPLHVLRLIYRGYNQSEVLAKYVARYINLPLFTNVLNRRRFTRSQSKFKAKGRVKNILGAFAVKDPERVRGKRVLLVDDVYTTGATVEECARVLKRAGAKSVYVVTGAMTC